MIVPIKNRYEFVFLFDVENGNPNGDPDAGNMPRLDPETNIGLVTDVCLKRKIRNFVELAPPKAAGFDIFIKEKAVLNAVIERAYVEDKELEQLFEKWRTWEKNKIKKKKKKEADTDDDMENAGRPGRHYEDLAKDWMCKNFYDVRTFGAVMTTGDKEKEEDDGEKSKLRKTAGQVRGPVQLNFAKSIDPITPLEFSITRMAVANESKADEGRTMGRKHIVPYGLYRAEGFISAHLAAQTGFGEDDLELLWQALMVMFDHDHSAARGKMSARKLVVFKHDSALGNAPAQKLFDLVGVSRATDKSAPARAYSDYAVAVDAANLPAGVELIEKL